MPTIQVYNFTVRGHGPGKMAALITDVEVCVGHDPAGAVHAGAVPPFHPFKAIWDTGATHTVITQPIVDAVGLQPTGMKRVHGVSGVHDAETYLVNVRIPSGPHFINVNVSKGQLPAGVHALIGMDIITMGDFAVTNFGGNTVFSFRVPSLAEIDFMTNAPRQKLSGQLSDGRKGFSGGRTKPHRHK